LQGKKGPEVRRQLLNLSFFPTPTPVTLEIKIKEVFNPFFGAFYGQLRAKSAGLY